MSNQNSTVTDLAANIKDHVVIDRETGTISAPKEIKADVDGKSKNVNLFSQVTGVAEEDYKKVMDAVHNWTAAGEKLTGELGTDILKDKGVGSSVTGTFPMVGKDNVTTKMIHSRDNRNPSTGEVTTSYGNLSSTVTIDATRKTASIREVRDAVKEAAAEALSGN